MPTVGKVIRKSIFEMRYAPEPTFFDRRGAILNQLFKDESGSANFQHWKMNSQRIDVFDPEEDRVCFVSFNNAGYHIEYQPSPNYFREQVTKYMGIAARDLALKHLNRIGVRTGFVQPVESFDKTLGEIVKAFYPTHDARFKELTGQLVDLQAMPLICKEGRYNFRITAGAMKSAEYEDMGLFNKLEGLPDNSLWVDIDYSTSNLDIASNPARGVEDFVNHAEERISKKYALFLAMVAGGR